MSSPATLSHPNQTAPSGSMEEEIRAKVAAVYQQYGDAHIKKLLQEEISKVKKKESELAALKKNVASATRDCANVQDKIIDVVEQDQKAENSCRCLQQLIRTREDYAAKSANENEERYKALAENVEKHLREARERCAVRRTAVDKIMEENQQLAQQVEEKKRSFEDSFTQLKADISSRTGDFEALLISCQQVAKETEVLEAKLLLVRREQRSVNGSLTVLREQLQLYDGKLEAFAQSAMRPEDVEEVTRQQRAQGETRIAAMEKEKAEANQLRLQLDKDLKDIRAKHASLRRELIQLEKQKTAAEKKCRQAQQKMHGQGK